MKFKIKNYSYRNKPLGDSGVKIVLYNGNSVHSRYEIKPEVGDAKRSGYMVTIFTIDARKDAPTRIHEGDFDEPPYITAAKTGRQNWWGTLDRQMWSNLPWGTYLQGVYTTRGNRLFNIEEGLYYRVQNFNRWQCESANWWGSFDRQGWSTCSKPFTREDGYFMAGFYRTGHMWDWKAGTYQLEMARCCKANGGGWGTCNEQPAFARTGGWARCANINGQEAAMVGLYRNNRGDVHGITKMKCCTLK